MNASFFSVMNKSKSFAVAGLYSALACSAPAALSITNGDFEGSGFVEVGTTGVTFGAYNTDLDGWYDSEWSVLADGGPSGTGDAYGQYPGSGTKIRGMMNIITDNNTTTGSVTMSVDLLAVSGSSFFNIKVWGINDSDLVTPGMQWDGYFDLNGPSGNPDALDLRDIGQSSTEAVSYAGDDIVQLLSIDVNILGTTWQQGNEFTFDLGSTGYDLVAIGFSYGTTGSALGVDNLQVIPEPGSLVLIGLGFGALLTRRRR